MTVLETVEYIDPQGRVWHAHEGLVTDGASIPQSLWSLVGSPFTGLYRVAAVFHDEAYATLGILKADADHMLYQAMLELKCPLWQADAVYAGVKEGGQASYVDDQIRTGRIQVTETTTTVNCRASGGQAAILMAAIPPTTLTSK